MSSMIFELSHEAPFSKSHLLSIPGLPLFSVLFLIGVVDACIFIVSVILLFTVTLLSLLLLF